MAYNIEDRANMSRIQSFRSPFSVTFTAVFVVTFSVMCYRDFKQTQASPKFIPTAPYANSVGMKLVRLPGGEFLMGTDRLGDELPVHRVVLSPFWIAQCEVTNAQFERFKKRPRPVESLTDQQPVTRITWYEAAAYCRWLSKKEGKPYRLPTEAEWEYAARGGLVQQNYPWPDELFSNPNRHATFESLATTPVGHYEPNGYGLYDMAGNVAEWVSDWYDGQYYAHSPLKDPQGPPAPRDPKYREHILRGGCFDILEGECWKQMASPDSIVPDMTKFSKGDQDDGSGFRVVMDDRHPITRLTP